MSNYIVADSDLTSVANAIRTKGGTSAALAFPAGFVSAVQAIPSGSSGISLLASGTYTKTDEAALSLSIPVSYSGKAALAFCYAEPISGVGQTNKWVGTPQPPQPIVDNLAIAQTILFCQATLANGSVINAACGIRIENGNLILGVQSYDRKIQPNTYYWYLWG